LQCHIDLCFVLIFLSFVKEGSRFFLVKAKLSFRQAAIFPGLPG